MKKSYVLLIFAALSIIFTYPLILHLDTALSDDGDPLLNTWILAWGSRCLSGFSLSQFFDANVFYPNRHTLAYSEHLFVSSLMAFPFILVSGSPVLGYNMVFLLSLVLSGFGMYCLVVYLTGNKYAGVIAGMVYAFCPFRFDHLPHLQLQTSQWIPFAFLYLHKFLEKSSPRDLALFTLFFILQALSCGYYAVFLGVSVVFLIMWSFARLRKPTRTALLLLAFVVVSAAAIYPFYRPYAEVSREMGFSRSIEEASYYSANIRNYLAASSGNRLYGGFADFFGKPEARLFPGFLALFLSFYGLLRLRGRGREPVPRLRLPAIDILILVSILIGLLIFFIGDITFERGGFRFSAHSLRNPLLIISMLFFIRHFLPVGKKPFILSHLARRYFEKVEGVTGVQMFYLFLLILAFVLSLGPPFFVYRLFYKFILPFRGLRVASRWGMMVIFAISVLSGFGVKRLKGKIKSLLPFILIAEYACFPLSFYYIPRDVPPVYNWLRSEEEDTVVLELPIASSERVFYKEAKYMYWSTFHWKRLGKI